MYACGLRVREAATLPVNAIDKASGLLRVIGKGNKERLVPVPRPVHDSLRRMWQAEDHRNRTWLFPNCQRNGPLNPRVLAGTFAAAVKLAQPAVGQRPTRCAIPMPPGCSRPRSTFAPSRSCSATPTSARRPSTRI